MALIDLLVRPPRLPRAVERPRVRQALLGGSEPGCLVVAPPGSGKTVAAAQTLAGHRRHGWCRLALGASTGTDLVRLVGAALEVEVDTVGVGPLERAAAMLDILGDQPTTLVIDDYELGRPEECDPLLAEVLALAPPDCRVIVCSAARPAGLVGRASVGQIRLVDGHDLVFTVDEVVQLLASIGRPATDAADLHATTDGWPAAVAMLALSPGGLDEVAARLTDSPVEAELLAVLSLVPSISERELAKLGFPPDLVGGLAADTALLRPVGDSWALLDAARQPVRDNLGDGSVRVAGAKAAELLAQTDPAEAADVLLQVGDPAAAADVLARHASSVPPDAAIDLLYRMPAEVRRRLPPELSEARATVEMDHALTDAEQRLATATDERERVEAQVAVGAILVHRGQLSSACTVLESALRAPRWTAVEARGAALGWLSLVRWWAGDVDGAAATVDVDPGLGEPSPLAVWVGAQVALAPVTGGGAGSAGGGPVTGGQVGSAAVARSIHKLQTVGWRCAAEAVTAQLALAEGNGVLAAEAAARAYQDATSHGGFDLLVAGPVHAWCLARAGRWDEATAVVDTLRRRLGKVDVCARLQADLVAEAAAQAQGDTVAAARHTQAIAMVRRLGYAVVEASARRWLPIPEPGSAGLEVGVLGPIVVRIDGPTLDDAAWRSRKAREVLVVLAVAGAGGLTRDEVIEAVWPEREPKRGRTLLRTALAEIRRVLEPGRQPGERSRFVVTQANRIVLDCSTDLAQAEELRTETRRPDADPSKLVVAWRLFRGSAAADEPYLASLDDLRRRAERVRMAVAEGLVARPEVADADVLRSVADYLETEATWRADLREWLAALLGEEPRPQ